MSILEYLQKKLVIHWDLKLANLFISGDMKMKLGDFGLACVLNSEKERWFTICGTPNYIAPEVLSQKGHSFEVDIWSYGIIIFTMASGVPPFEKKDVKETYD